MRAPNSTSSTTSNSDVDLNAEQLGPKRNASRPRTDAGQIVRSTEDSAQKSKVRGVELRRLPSSEPLTSWSRPTIISKSKAAAKVPRVAINTTTADNNTSRKSTTTTPRAATPQSSPRPTATTSARSARSARSASSLSSRAAAPAPTRPPSSTASRQPLRPRDQNAAMVTSRPPLNKSATMPAYDRSPNAGVRPQMPSLSAAAQRAMNRSPLTPKVATKAPQTPTIGPNTHTPLARRTQRPATANSGAFVSSKPIGEEDEVPSYLSNITPRSGSRQNRVDSANTTPNGTPNPDRDGWDRAASPLAFDTDAMRRPAVTFSSIPSELNGHSSQESQNNPDSKFFYASDVKTAPLTSPPPPKPVLAKAPTFFYANGNTIENKTTSPALFTPVGGQAQPQESLSNKFVYANGTPDLRPSPPPVVSRPGSTISVASKAPQIRSAASAVGSPYPIAQRPSSPIKLAQQPQLAPRKNGNLPPLATSRAQVASPPQLASPAVGIRRSSTGTSRGGSHSRTGSLVMGEASMRSSQISSEASSPSMAALSQPGPLTLASIIQAAEDLSDNEDLMSPDDARSTRSSHSTDPINELVANARRERKVQDLEITNASLEAINRTLERQLRKQTAELRRFRRLSRSGRLSMTSTTISNRVVSESIVSDPGSEFAGLSDMSDNESDEDDLDEESLSDTDSASESANPGRLAERDAKHRKQDEKRLQLDLSKHQELLIDSQKINQSIKRCLDWSEELIKEGKKALAYHVRVSDVEIGGRVLNPVDEEDELANSSIQVAPEQTVLVEDLLKPTPRLAGWEPDLQDRDSGIELPVDGG